MKKIVWGKPNGEIAITAPLSSAREGETEEQYLARVAMRFKQANPHTSLWIRLSNIESTDIPEDRTFRNAWKPDLTVDMPKAREIHREHLRRLRDPLLHALDEAYLRANEFGDLSEKARIAARKQALRDVTADPAIEAAATPEILAAVIPAALKPE